MLVDWRHLGLVFGTTRERWPKVGEIIAIDAPSLGAVGRFRVTEVDIPRHLVCLVEAEGE